jgi:transporter family-2 protein
MNLALYLMAFAAGAAIPTQAAVNGQLAGTIGNNTVAAAFVSFAVGAIVLGIATFARGGMPAMLAALPAQAPWKFAGGFLGAGFIFSTVFLAPRIGILNMLAMIFAGQLIASMFIDHFGLVFMAVRKVSAVRLVGALVMMTGVALVLFGDRVSAALGR